MLEANTDRIWFTIGSILIGAVIVMMGKESLPKIFGDVTNQMDAFLDDATLIETETKPNLIPNSDNLLLWHYAGGAARTGVRTFSNGWTRLTLPTNAYEFGTDTNIDVKPNETYTQSMYIKTDASRIVDPEISFFWAGYTGDANQKVAARVQRIEGDLYRLSATAKTRAGQARMRVPDIFVTFDGGTYVEFGEFKLEEGSIVTDWVK